MRIYSRRGFAVIEPVKSSRQSPAPGLNGRPENGRKSNRERLSSEVSAAREQSSTTRPNFAGSSPSDRLPITIPFQGVRFSERCRGRAWTLIGRFKPFLHPFISVRGLAPYFRPAPGFRLIHVSGRVMFRIVLGRAWTLFPLFRMSNAGGGVFLCTAMEAGNSELKIRSNYRDAKSAEDAEGWFGV